MALSLAAVLLAALPQDSVRIEARFVDLEGEGIAGVTLGLDWSPQVAGGPSGPDGVVALDVSGNLGKSLLFSASHPELPGRSWMLLDRRSAPVHRLGDLQLPPGGTLTGRVVDADGERLPGEWSVQVRGRSDARAGQKLLEVPMSLSGLVDPGTGEFRIAGVPVGPAEVSASHPGLHLGTPEVEVTLEPEVETFVELPYFGPDPARSVRVLLELVGPAPATLAPVLVSVCDAEGEVTTHAINLRRSGSQRVFVEAGTPPFTVSHDDSRFEPVSLQAVGGERCDLRLVGSCTYRLNLVEAGSKRALPRAGLTMIRGEERTPILPANSAVRPQHPLPGIFPGEKLTFELALPGRPPLLVAAPNPRRGEVPWHLSVQPARTLLLDLVDDQGNACADVEVQVTQGTTAGTTGSPYTLNGALIPSVHYEVRSDERGRVTLRGLHATTHTLRVFFGPCLVHQETLSSDQLDAPQQIQEPQHGVLALDVLLPDHARTAAREGRLKLRVQPLGRRLSSNAGEFDPREPDLRVSLPPGEARVYGCMASQQGTWELAVTEIRAGEITALELDLTETCPGLVDLAVTVNGRDELAGWDGVFLGQVPGQEDEVQRLLSRVPRLHALLTPMQYQATLRADDRAWEVDLRFTLAPGEHFDRKLDFTLHERTLELRDASTGDPLAGGSLTLRRTRFEHTWDQEASIDAEGQASLRLVAGAAELMVDGYAPRTIEVPSGSDPFVVTLDPKESKKLPQSARAPR